jgi:hypothetical protein
MIAVIELVFLNEAIVWRESFPIRKDNVDYTLEIRYATEKDLLGDKPREKAPSQFYKYIAETTKEQKQVIIYFAN